ncbi:hypothetical protein BCR37DRAFT_387248 [Protomyces lactucae-debilis]|uniref:GRAM domain-containing protein n=1 Tax=Protomyces lactucae-debilis TaxID=2754530 RepID=A0A1Y2FF13_PROLT|nr:uncharacterized protein BCR37DRAFT_387248 [Protomyces lactucae-debilis]ORY82550.1 hypothetical protein BCR37DRAFT_387248 [Protomyces lactucae-debilis]
MSLNWTQLDHQHSAPLPLDNTEEILATQRVQATLLPRFPKPIPGTVFVTSHRIVFVSAVQPAIPPPASNSVQSTESEGLRTVGVPIERWNAQLIQPWFGANRYDGEVAPVAGGGLDGTIATITAGEADRTITLSVSFVEGGVEAFHRAWVVARERTTQRLRRRRQERAVALGQASSMDDEEVDALPLYEEAMQS